MNKQNNEKSKDGITSLLNEHDVARITNMSVASVRRWRLFRQGPKYLKLSASVRYRAEDVAAWLDACASHPNQPDGR